MSRRHDTFPALPLACSHLYTWQRDQQDRDPVYPCVSCLFRYLGPLTTWSLNLLAEIDLIGSLWE